MESEHKISIATIIDRLLSLFDRIEAEYIGNGKPKTFRCYGLECRYVSDESSIYHGIRTYIPEQNIPAESYLDHAFIIGMLRDCEKDNPKQILHLFYDEHRLFSINHRYVMGSYYSLLYNVYDRIFRLIGTCDIIEFSGEVSPNVAFIYPKNFPDVGPIFIDCKHMNRCKIAAGQSLEIELTDNDIAVIEYAIKKDKIILFDCDNNIKKALDLILIEGSVEIQKI